MNRKGDETQFERKNDNKSAMNVNSSKKGRSFLSSEVSSLITVRTGFMPLYESKNTNTYVEKCGPIPWAYTT